MKEEICYFAWIPLLAFIIGRWSKKKERSQDNHYFFSLNQTVTKMEQSFEDFKAKLTAQSATIDTIKGSVNGIQSDVKYLKDLAAANPGGFTAEQVSELAGIVEGTDSKISEIASTTSQLDAETDPNANGGNGTGETV